MTISDIFIIEDAFANMTAKIFQCYDFRLRNKFIYLHTPFSTTDMFDKRSRYY